MEPLYRQIVEIIVRRIENGEYLPNEKLPAERELADLYGVNRQTVKKAMDVLVEMGFIYRSVGQGTFVKNRITMKKAMSMLENKGVYAPKTGRKGISRELESYRSVQQEPLAPSHGAIEPFFGKSETPGNRKLFFTGLLEGWPAVRARLRLSEGEQVFGLHSICQQGNTPQKVEYSYIPASLFEDAPEQNFNQTSLLDYMRARGHMPVDGETRLTLIQCPQRESKLLKLEEDKSAVFHLEYLGRESTGKMVIYSHAFIRAEDMAFRFYPWKPCF